MKDTYPGARPLPDGRCAFRVWAPRSKQVEVVLGERREALTPEVDGWHVGVLTDVGPGADYRFSLDGELPQVDPAARYLPEGVRGPARVVDLDYPWTDDGWQGVAWRDLVIYELHVGTYTPEGTFAAIIPHLPALRELGVTALELLPVAQNPGDHNWGYDAVYPWAVQHSYGGPRELQALVDACHREGLALLLDVVPNHLGPEDCSLPAFAPYLVSGKTPWGDAINLEAPAARQYWLDNFLSWLEDFHVDGLRIDAVHALIDDSPQHFLGELSQTWHARAAELGRQTHLIAEALHSKQHTLRPAADGGHGMDGEWSDDYHHALHAALTDERGGYYVDFGQVADVARVLREGWIHRAPGESKEPNRTTEPFVARTDQLVVYIQDHDQVGNRPRGDRLIESVSTAALRLAAAMVNLSPFTPMLWQGEEWLDDTPFPFFVDHRDAGLKRRVKEGRREGFKRFGWDGSGDLDPGDPATFQAAKLDPGAAKTPEQEAFRAYTRELLTLRQALPRVERPGDQDVRCLDDVVVFAARGAGADRVALVGHFGGEPHTLTLPDGPWTVALDSEDPRWGGAGALASADGEVTLRPHQALLLRAGQ